MDATEETLAQAEAAERAAFAAVAALGEREIAEIKAWIASGCEGARPLRDVEARRVLATRLNAAVAAREAAERAACGSQITGGGVVLGSRDESRS